MSRILNIKYIGRQKHQTFPKKQIFGFKKLVTVRTKKTKRKTILNLQIYRASHILVKFINFNFFFLTRFE